MAVELYRVDDRLIHGQVVVGWGQPLDIEFVVLVDDVVASSEWEQELYQMAVPPGMAVYFADVAGAVAAHDGYVRDGRRGVVITGDIATMAGVVAGTAASANPVRRVNVGGLHHRADRTQRLRYVFLSSDEERELRALAARGAVISAQDVPSAREVPLEELLCSRGT